MKIDFMFIVGAVFAIAGTIQWVKSFVTAVSAKSGLPWVLMSFAFSYAAGFLYSAYVKDAAIALMAVFTAHLVLAALELLWQLILKIIIQKVQAASGEMSDQSDAIAKQIIAKVQSVLPKSDATDPSTEVIPNGPKSGQGA